MAKLRIVDGKPEFDGDPNELAEIYKSLDMSIGIATRNTDIATEIEKEVKTEIKIPTADQIIAVIEERGRPFNISMVEEQLRLYGKVISSKTDRSNYERFYGESRKAMKKMLKKHKGKWDATTEMIGKHQSKRYTLIEDDTKQSVLKESNIVPHAYVEPPKSVELPKTQRQKEEVDLFKM
jgi:hypothetical protein